MRSITTRYAVLTVGVKRTTGQVLGRGGLTIVTRSGTAEGGFY